MLGLDCTRRLSASNCGCLRNASNGPALPDELDAPAEGTSSPSISGGIPFIKNSTAISGLPSEARRQALTDDSGNPSAMRLLTTSAENSSGELTSDAAAAAAGVAGAAADAVDGAGAEGVGGTTAAAAGVAGAAAAASAAAGAAASAGFAAGAFLALHDNLVL